MNLSELRKQCENFDISTSNFSSIVKNGLNLLGSLQRDFAAEFDVNESTISRWAKGTAKPLPRFQKLVIKSILRKAKKLASLYEEPVEDEVIKQVEPVASSRATIKKIAGPSELDR